MSSTWSTHCVNPDISEPECQSLTLSPSCSKCVTAQTVHTPHPSGEESSSSTVTKARISELETHKNSAELRQNTSAYVAIQKALAPILGQNQNTCHSETPLAKKAQQRLLHRQQQISKRRPNADRFAWEVCRQLHYLLALLVKKFVIFLLVLHATPDSIELVDWGTRHSVGIHCWVEKPCYRRKTSLVVGGTRTQVLADSMAIAASALNHCTT